MLNDLQCEKDKFRALIEEDIIGNVVERLNIKHRKPLMSLAMGRPGERLIIVEVRAGRHARERLTSLGLNPGDLVEIINNSKDGRLVIGHNNTRVAIGRGIGEKILVTVSDNIKS